MNSKRRNRFQRGNLHSKQVKKKEQKKMEKIEKYLEKFNQVKSKKKSEHNKHLFKIVSTEYKHKPPFFSLSKELTGSLKDIQPIGNLVREFSFNIIRQNKFEIDKKLIENHILKKPKFKIQYVIG